MLEYLSPWIQTTNRCNLACPYCYINKDKMDMSVSTYEQIFNKLSLSIEKHQVKMVCPRLAGGEPLLVFEVWKEPVKHFKQRLKECSLVEVITNLTLIPEGLLEFIADGYILLNVSLDGIEHSKPYKNGLSSAEVVLQNIRTLSEVQPEFFVMTTLSATTWEGLTKLAEYIGVHKFRWHITLDRFYNGNPPYWRLLNTLKEVILVLKEADYPLGKLQFNFCGIEPNGGCHMGKELFAIYTDGTIFPCHTLFHTKPSGSVWESRDLIDFLAVDAKRVLSKDCQSCSLMEVCCGDCPLYSETAKQYGFCQLAKGFLLTLVENTLEKYKEVLNAK